MFVGLILLASLGLSCSFRVVENVVFEKTQEVSVVRSKWIFSFFTDLRAYQGYMGRLFDNLETAEQVINKVTGLQRHNYYLPLYKRQEKELLSIQVAAQDYT